MKNLRLFDFIIAFGILTMYILIAVLPIMLNYIFDANWFFLLYLVYLLIMIVLAKK